MEQVFAHQARNNIISYKNHGQQGNHQHLKIIMLPAEAEISKEAGLPAITGFGDILTSLTFTT